MFPLLQKRSIHCLSSFLTWTFSSNSHSMDCSNCDDIEILLSEFYLYISFSVSFPWTFYHKQSNIFLQQKLLDPNKRYAYFVGLAFPFHKLFIFISYSSCVISILQIAYFKFLTWEQLEQSEHSEQSEQSRHLEQ